MLDVVGEICVMMHLNHGDCIFIKVFYLVLDICIVFSSCS